MDLYEIRGGRLDVIAEEAEHQELDRDVTNMEHHKNKKGRTTRDVPTLQRFSVDTNESLCFEPCEDSSPSPTGAEDGHDDVFQEGAEVGHTDLFVLLFCFLHLGFRLANPKNVRIYIEEAIKFVSLIKINPDIYINLFVTDLSTLKQIRPTSGRKKPFLCRLNSSV